MTTINKATSLNPENFLNSRLFNVYQAIIQLAQDDLHKMRCWKWLLAEHKDLLEYLLLDANTTIEGTPTKEQVLMNQCREMMRWKFLSKKNRNGRKNLAPH